MITMPIDIRISANKLTFQGINTIQSSNNYNFFAALSAGFKIDCILGGQPNHGWQLCFPL